MLVKTNGIILNNTKYSENSVISHIFTRDYGKLSFIVNGVRNNKGAIKSSHLQALNLVDLDLYYSNSKTIHRIKDLKVSTNLQELHTSPVKIAITFLITEVLTKSIKEEEENEELYRFIYLNVIEVNNSPEKELSNFPAYFILNLASILGHNIVNDVIHNSVTESRTQGIYSSRSLSTILFSEEEKNKILQILTPNYDNDIGSSWSKKERISILNKAVDYFESVVIENSKINSLEVIRTVMA